MWVPFSSHKNNYAQDVFSYLLFTDYVDYIVQKFHSAGLTFIFIPFFFIIFIFWWYFISSRVTHYTRRRKVSGEKSEQVVCKVNIWIINLAILLYFRYFYTNKYKQRGYMLCFVFLAKMWEVRSLAYVTHFKCSNITIWQLLLLEGFRKEIRHAGGMLVLFYRVCKLIHILAVFMYRLRL